MPFAAAAPLAVKLAPAFITAGAGLVDSVINAFSTSSANNRNIALAREQMAWQSEESEKARQASRDFSLEMFDLENAYNTPLAQIERLREAGINPYAALSQGSSQISGQASGNASLPGLMPGGVAMPHVSPIPSPVAGFLPALQAFAEIKLKDAQAKKAGAETSEIMTLLDAKFKELASRADVQSAQACYQDTLNRLETVHGDSQRVATIKKLAAEATLAELRGETEKADKLLKDAEAALTGTKNAQLIEQAPVILANLREEGRLLRAKQATERSLQSLNYAAASEHRAGASVKEETFKLTRAEVKIKEELIDDLIYAQRLANGRAMQELGELAATFPARVQHLKDQHLIDEETYKELEQKRALAEKANSWYYWHEYLNFFESVSRDVGNVAKMVPTPAR